MTRLWCGTAILLALIGQIAARAQEAAFAVASIRPSTERVQFESDGETKLEPGTVRMRDVTIETCIKWAYGVQKGQVSGPGVLTSERYDLVAKSDGPAEADAMRKMMRTLLLERFGLRFHKEKKELRTFALVAGKGGIKMKAAVADEVPYRRNSSMGTTARATTMGELGDLLASAVEKPVVDKTGLTGRWDFGFDFTRYMTDEPKSKDDFLRVLNTTLEGELGLKMVPEKDVLEVIVVDRVEKASAN